MPERWLQHRGERVAGREPGDAHRARLASPRCELHWTRGCCPVSVDVSERGSETTRRGVARVCFATLSPRRTMTTRTGVSKRTCTGFPVRVWIQWVFTWALGVTTVSSLCSSDPTMRAAQLGRFATSEMWSVSPGLQRAAGPDPALRGPADRARACPCESVARTETSLVPQPATVKCASACRAPTRLDDGYADAHVGGRADSAGDQQREHAEHDPRPPAAAPGWGLAGGGRVERPGLHSRRHYRHV